MAVTEEKLSAATGTESRGAIFTRPKVVDFMLELVGYIADKPLQLGVNGE